MLRIALDSHLHVVCAGKIISRLGIEIFESTLYENNPTFCALNHLANEVMLSLITFRCK